MRRSLTVVAGAVLAGVLMMLSACGNAEPQPVPDPHAAHAAAGPDHDAADLAFVLALIPHHRAGIALASAVAQPAGARTLAEAIIVTQRDEVIRMTGWLAAWGASAPPATRGPSGRTTPPTPNGRTARPTPSGRNPPSGPSEPSGPSGPSGGDALRALIAHQEEAVTLAQSEQARGANPTALAFARQIIESRTAEADQLRTYLG